MEFKIKVIDVENAGAKTKTGKPYDVANVSYRDLEQDKVTARKVTSYNGAHSVLKDAVKGQVYLIDASKKDGSDYWDWDKATLTDDASGKSEGSVSNAVAGARSEPTSGARSAPKSTYETAEERAVKQAAINRSAAVARAIEYLEANSGGKVFTVGDVLGVANVFDKFIVEGDKSTNPFADMKDDLVD